MKIEPRKIKKTLKYAAVGACVATSLVTAGCEKERPVLPGGDVPIENVQPTEEVYLDGDIATTPTPEIAGGIPTPAIYDEDDEEETDDEIEFSGEPVSYWEEE